MEQAEQDVDADTAAEIDVVPNPPNPHQQLYDVMFDEINENYLQEKQRMNNNNQNDINNNGAQRQEAYQLTLERILQSADAELLLYRQESSLPLQDAQGKFCCPLTWWRNHSTKYKMLSKVALHLFCIPATPAPSERVFSVAGLTIAKDQARLNPQTANDLIFLLNALPAIRNFEQLKA